MKYTFSDLVDTAKVQRLTDLFYSATGVPASVIGLDGTIITASGWQAICTNFHRTNPRTAQRCVESDTIIANQVAAGRKYTVYRCKNGLIDAATPITVEGDHVANFFTGQFLFGPPDMEYFREQARDFGFDETAYMEAVARIPVIEEARLGPFLDYLSEFAVILGEMGLRQLKQIEAAAVLRRYEMLARHTRDIVLFLRADNGRILEANIAATKAYGYTRQELLSLTIHDIRDETTRGEEMTAQMEEAIDKGLLFETVHRRKDGTTFPVEVSSRGETIDGDQMLISVVRDITERKRAENAIRESEQRWATTLASVGDAVIATDRLGRITFMNTVAEELTGWRHDEAAAKPVNAVFHIVNERTRKPVDNPVDKVLQEGMIVGLANHTILVRKDRTEIPIDDSGAPIRDKDGAIVGVVLVFRDITERKRAEEEANHLASFPAFNPNPVLEVDVTGTITFCNEGAHRILRDLGLTGEDCTPFLPEDLQDILRDWDKKNETVLTREVPVKDRTFEETVLLFPGFRVARIYAFDITGRKLREARITRLTRLYAMLSRANEVIVRARDRASLYAELCRTIAEEGSFPLVWIGEVKNARVVPVASSGRAVAYLDEISVEVNGVLGQGPTGVCMRENRPVINHDFDANTATGPWRETALRHGFRASAAFPLPGDNGFADALMIYASGPHDFDEEQVGLLEGLAADIAYALETMKKEKLRVRAESDLQHSLKRFELLAHTAGELLRNPDPQKLVNSLCEKVMEHLDCHAFFNFLVVNTLQRLRLNAYAGIPEEEARRIEWLDYGVAVCGCAARDCSPIVAEHIPTTSDPRTELVKSYGIKAYACHPLFGPDEEVLGTLSFGSRSKETFSDEDLSLMKAVADQVAVAMIRMRDEENVKKTRDLLEERVMERTAELQEAYDKLMRETEEREKVERQLRQAQKMEALGTLAGGIAHDFNNMLAAIIGFTELIKDHLPEESREHRHAQRVLEAGIRGRELVRQMLTFSRQTEQEKKPLRLSAMIEEGVKLLRASIPSTVSIIVNVKSESGVIMGDPVQVQQVLMNLATNAAYAMREKGGTLDIELSDFSVSPSNAVPSGMEPGMYMRMIVRDTGMGMPPEIIDRIFDPFFTTKKIGEGTGLGLSVVLGIIRQARGYITVESRPGSGSAFTVYFPKAIQEQAAEGTARDETVPTGQERILFIDDEEALAEMGEDLLAELGYEVTCRTSSREALALFRLDPSFYDMVITDQTMPDLTGIELAREILAIRPGFPIILATGYSQSVDEATAKAAGIKAFVLKPLTKKEIARTVRRVLDKA